MIDTPTAITKVPAGQEINNPKPGDFFLVHRNTFVAKLIQFGQRRRFTKEESYWNHCGTFINENGDIVEALVRSGVTPGNITKYKDIEYIVVHVDASDEGRANMQKVASWLVGKPYGILTDISLALWCIIGGHFSFGLDDQTICSAVVARVLEASGYIFDRGSAREMPADLARHFKVYHP